MERKLNDIMSSLKKGKRTYRVEIDMEGRIVGWTDDALELIGYSLKEMEELTVFDLVTDLELLVEAFETMPEAESEYEVTLVHKSGKKMPIKVFPEVIMKDGEIFRVKCVFHLV